MSKKKKSITDNLDDALEEYQKYLKKIQKKKSSNPTEFERNTAPLIFLMGYALKDIKESINTNTLVMTLCFIGLGIIFSIGFTTI